jgi:hypothetical protein
MAVITIGSGAGIELCTYTHPFFGRRLLQMSPPWLSLDPVVIDSRDGVLSRASRHANPRRFRAGCQTANDTNAAHDLKYQNDTNAEYDKNDEKRRRGEKGDDDN